LQTKGIMSPGFEDSGAIKNLNRLPNVENAGTGAARNAR